MDFVFITDIHISSASKVRSGDLLTDLKNKLDYVVEYCNQNDAQILIGGDLFDKPSLPDFVKSFLAPTFKKAKYVPIAVSGNHDRLYDNPEYNYKTSYNVWVSHGIIKSIDDDFVDLGDVVISSKLPVVDLGKPKIVIYHGFLNQEDGRNTLRFTDIDTSEPTYILLGHDHVEYEPLQYKDNVKIFRPGSLLRGVRNDDQERIPKMVHIKVIDGKLKYKLVPILCRDPKEIFKTKEAKVSKAEQHHTYEDIISQIRNAQKTDLTLEDALKQVADPDVCDYVKVLLTESKIESQHKKQNL